MEKYKDFSLHFTIKNQSFEELQKKFYEFDSPLINFGEAEENEPDLILHHCFLPPEIVKAKGFSTEIIDFLESITDEEIRWYQATDSLEQSRWMMLRNLKRLGGVALFLGEIKEGVEAEYEMVKLLNIPCFLIN